MSQSIVYDATGAIQSVIVPETGLYDIASEGATGGADAAGDAGGAGAAVSGSFELTAGDVIDILVGEAGEAGTSTEGGGGGGGTFVYDATTGMLLEAAGGGGGAGAGSATSGVPGDPGQAGAADNGGASGGAAGTANSAAQAGDHPVSTTYSFGGGGGGGYYFNGDSTEGYSQGYGGGGGESFITALNGSTGSFGSGGEDGGNGGFGGGGGGQYFYGGGGGGGGFTGGGGGGLNDGYGGGGGSYDRASDALMATGFNTLGDGMVTVTLPDAPCFAAGTRILGQNGDMKVEDIRPGDCLVTLNDGEPAYATVLWAGKRSIDMSRHPEPDLVRPVRIRAGAFGLGLPERDLRLSPHHAVYFEGNLFEAIALVNGNSIFQEYDCTHVTYHHIELAAHGILLAEGLPVESFLDTGNRAMFDGQSVTVLHPEFRTAADAARCAPLVLEGEALAQACDYLDRQLHVRGVASAG
jgi:hypothetical protein